MLGDPKIADLALALHSIFIASIVKTIISGVQEGPFVDVI